MATQMVQRSTDWVINYGHNNTPDPTGDYRHFWVIYYDTDKTNRLTKFTVDYYLQTHNTDYTDSTLDLYIPAGTANVYINDSSIGTCSNKATSTDKGDNYRLRYLGSKTFNIYHNDDGSARFTFKGTGFGIGSGTSTYYTPKHFPSIASPSIVGTVNTFDIDSGVSIPVTKYVSSYYDVLEISNGSNIFKTIENATNGFTTKTSTPISVAFTNAELDNIYTKIPKGENATFTFKLTTYTDSGKTSKVGDSSKTAIGNFTIVLPSVRGAICTDIYSNNPEFTGDSTKQTIIKGWSKVNVAIPTNMQAIANTRKATIVEYVVNDVPIPYNANGISEELPIDAANKDHVIIYAVDSRGTSSLAYTQKFTKYIDYKSPVMNDKTYEITRDESGISRFVTASFDGTWWQGNFGAKENNLRPEVWYRDATDGYWEDIYDFLDGATKGSLDASLLNTSTDGSFSYNGPIMSAESDKGFDIKLPYDIVILIWDELGGCYVAVTVQYGEPAGAIYKNKMALGGPYDETLGGTQMWGDVYLNGNPLSSIFPVGSIYMSVIEVDPDKLFGGKWERLENMFLFGASDTHPVGEEGGEESHALTITELAKHSHVQLKAGDSKNHHPYVSSSNSYSTANYADSGSTTTSTKETGIADYYQSAYGSNYLVATRTTGTGEAHNNMPPYLSVYMWKRVE